jgi:hypothetical protein
MADKSGRVIRQMECPEGRGKASLLVEWRVERGKKILHSVSCNDSLLMDYSGRDCQWLCWEKISRGKG